ncbi:S1 RNA-binding domain-containing protein [Nocardia tengchongensis]|uniref:S1 RNA-binding domain-containing protein n=1 Tax=Nocardia tengchongensis TaxID=2055889 RepID=UPI003696D2F3
MSDLQLLRDERPIEGRLFAITPYGKKTLHDGQLFDFDAFYQDGLVPVIEEAGYTPVRADSIYGPQSLMGPIWRGIQQAEVVLVDFTLRSPNVAMEFAWATIIGKKCVYLTQDSDDIPTDVRGRLRHILYSDRFNDVNRMREELRNQLQAMRSEPSVEMALLPMAAGGIDPVPAKVITVTPEFAVIEASGGRRGVLGNADVDYNRIVGDMSKMFAVGDSVAGAFDVDTGGGMKYTLLAGTTNPWPSLRAELPVGKSLVCTVRRIKESLGAFVDIGYGIEGLIHADALGGRTVSVGDRVEVTVGRIDVERRRIALQLDRVATGRVAAAARIASPGERSYRVGQRAGAEVARVVRLGEGGYLLVVLPGRRANAMLHGSAMTPELRADLRAGRVEAGEVLDVEVVDVDVARDRISVRDLPEDSEEEAVEPIGA